jgi:hypothetical protein
MPLLFNFDFLPLEGPGKPGGLKLNGTYELLLSVQNILSSRLLYRKVKIRISKMLFCLWFCMGVKLGL